MEWRRFFGSYRAVLQENRIWRTLSVALALANVILVILVVARRDTVVLVPANLTKEVRVGASVGDRAYRESWGLFFALMLGNVTPKTIDFVLERTGKYLAPGIYQDTLKDMYSQAQQLKVNNLTISFEPNEVAFDAKNDRVQVKGVAVLRGAYGAPTIMARTYDLGIEVRNYQPVLTYLSAYEKQEDPEGEKDQKNQKDKPVVGAPGGPAGSRR